MLVKEDTSEYVIIFQSAQSTQLKKGSQNKRNNMGEP